MHVMAGFSFCRVAISIAVSTKAHPPPIPHFSETTNMDVGTPFPGAGSGIHHAVEDEHHNIQGLQAELETEKEVGPVEQVVRNDNVAARDLE